MITIASSSTMSEHARQFISLKRQDKSCRLARTGIWAFCEEPRYVCLFRWFFCFYAWNVLRSCSLENAAWCRRPFGVSGYRCSCCELLWIRFAPFAPSVSPMSNADACPFLSCMRCFDWGRQSGHSYFKSPLKSNWTSKVSALTKFFFRGPNCWSTV